VKRQRERLGISQEGPAEAADIHRTHVGFIERGERSPTVDVAARVAKALKMPLSALVADAEAKRR
jgi:DNA-binding XRE family transcriptional regulator